MGNRQRKKRRGGNGKTSTKSIVLPSLNADSIAAESATDIPQRMNGGGAVLGATTSKSSAGQTVTVCAAVLSALVALATYLYTVWHDHRRDNQESAVQSDIATLRDNYNSLHQGMTALKDAVLTLSSTVAPQLQKSITEQVKNVAANRNSAPVTETDSVLASVSTFITGFTQKKIPAQESFFKANSDSLKTIATTPAIFKTAAETQTKLADYRSSLDSFTISLPKGYCCEMDRSFHVSDLGGLTLGGEHPPQIVTLNGKRVLVSALMKAKTPYGDFFVYAHYRVNGLPERTAPPNPVTYIENMIFIDGSQTLDFFDFKDVVFFNTEIRYRGGPYRLQNVRFINCRFDVSTDQTSFDLLQNVATLPLPSSSITAASGE